MSVHQSVRRMSSGADGGHGPAALSKKVNDDLDGSTDATTKGEAGCGCGTFRELLLPGFHTDRALMRLTFTTETKSNQRQMHLVGASMFTPLEL